MASSQLVAAKFSELLEGSHNLPTSTNKLGRVLLNLDEIEACVKQHVPENSKTGSHVHYLLAGSGFDAQHVSSAIKAMDVALPSRVLDNQRKPNDDKSTVDSFLSGKKQDSVQSSIDDLVLQSTKEFEQYLGAKIQIDWKSRKQMLYQTLGLSAGPQSLQNTTMMGVVDTSLAADTTMSAIYWNRSRVGKEILGHAVSNTNSLLTLLPEFEDRCTEVKALVDAWQNRQQQTVLDIFGNASFGHSSRSLVQMNLMWRALRELVEAGPSLRNGMSTRNSSLDSPAAVELTLQIIRASKSHLQSQYRKFMDAEIEARRLEAKVGGVPSSINKTMAFVRLKHFSNGQWKQGLELIDGQPLWAYVFHLLRAGCQSDVIEILNVRPELLGSVETKFVGYLKDWIASPDKRLKPEQEETLHSYYLTYFRDGRTFDVYKQALFKIIGRCDLQHKNLPQVVVTIEDWLWLQLHLIQDSPSESVLNETYRFNQLQSLILELGPNKFQTPNSGSTGSDDVSSNYFAILMLSGLYEDAIAYLLPHNEPLAVHFTIALCCFGLIRPLSDPRLAEINTAGTDIVNMDHTKRVLVRQSPQDPRPQLNVAEILGRYTRLFRASAPEKAVDYLVLIGMCSSVNSDYQKLAVEALQQLVLESREYVTLLGSAANGLSGGSVGVIQNRAALLGFDERQYKLEMVQSCADLANQEGRVDAIMLYFLAGRFSRVLELTNAVLCRSIVGVRLGHRITTTMPHSLVLEELCCDDEPPHLARSIVACFERHHIEQTLSGDELSTTRSLLGFVSALDAFADGKYEQCFELIDQSGAVNMGPAISTAKLRLDATNFSRLNDQLSRAVPTMLMAMLEGCSRLMKQFSSHHRQMPTDLKAQIRQRAANCIVFAGLIEFRMPRQMYAQMNKLELEISS